MSEIEFADNTDSQSECVTHLNALTHETDVVYIYDKRGFRWKYAKIEYGDDDTGCFSVYKSVFDQSMLNEKLFSRIEIYVKRLSDFFIYYAINETAQPEVYIVFYKRKWFNPLRWLISEYGIKKHKTNCIYAGSEKEVRGEMRCQK